jgi:WD40 repeat protein
MLNPAHIYLSALPFTPPNSLISTYFLKAFPNVLRLSVGATVVPQAVLTAAISHEIVAVVIANGLFKVFNLDRGGVEIFHALLNATPTDETMHSTPGYCIAISSDGKTVALGHDGCSVLYLDGGDTKWFNLAQAAVARTTCLAFSDDGERLVTGLRNGDLHEWVVGSGVEGRQFQWPSDVDHDGLERQDVLGVVYAQADDCIVSASWRNSGLPQFSIWSQSGDCTFSYLLPQGFDHRVFHESSCWLFISACSDTMDNFERSQIQDPLTGKLQLKRSPLSHRYSGWIKRNDGWVRFMAPLNPISAISSDGKLSAVGLKHPPSIFIWDVRNHTQLAELVGHSDILTNMAFAGSNDASKYRLVTTWLDGTVRLWELDQLLKPKEVTLPNSLVSTYSLDTFPNILSLSVQVGATDETEESRPVMTAAVSGDLIAVVIANASLKVFNLQHRGTEIFHAQIDPIPVDERPPHADIPGYCLAISGDGETVALGRDSCYVWRLNSSGTRRLVLTQSVVARIGTCLAFSDDGEYLLTGFNNGDLHEWVVNSGGEGRQFLWPSDSVGNTERTQIIAAVYAHTDDRIISCSQMGRGPPRFYIWSRSGDCTFSYLLPEQYQQHPQMLHLSSRWVILPCYRAADNKWWQIHDPLTGELQFRCSPMPQGYSEWHGRIDERYQFTTPGSIMAISPDGKLAAFGLKRHPSIFIWDVHENVQLAELVGHSNDLTSAAFARSHGESKYRLVTTSLDGTIRVWDLDQLFKPKEDQHPMTFWRTCPEADGYDRFEGGSIQNGNGECLFWHPYSCPLRHPLNTLVIGRCAELVLSTGDAEDDSMDTT